MSFPIDWTYLLLSSVLFIVQVTFSCIFLSYTAFYVQTFTSGTSQVPLHKPFFETTH